MWQNQPECRDRIRPSVCLMVLPCLALNVLLMCHVWGVQGSGKRKACTEGYALLREPCSFFIWHTTHPSLLKNLLSYLHYFKLCLLSTSTENVEVSLFLLLTPLSFKFCIIFLICKSLFFLQNVKRIWTWNESLQFSLEYHLKHENKLCVRETEKQMLSGICFLF